MIFLISLGALLLTALLLFNQTKKTEVIARGLPFERLQKQYLTVYYLATFSDWLQGPYVYKLYSDYGYKEEDIAVLYIMGFASSTVFGAVVGHIADRYGRKKLCIAFGFFYSVCCLTKISSRFGVLLIGRVLGGISTSILFSTFEAWYINEHVNHLKLSPAWLNLTFSKAGFYTGFLAILAGIVSQICAESLKFGPASPFILAIPFLIMSSYLVHQTWKEHSYPQSSIDSGFIAPLVLILFQDRLLLLLGLIQSLFEAVMYTFIFSWTPIMSELDPPLGIVFACFMIAFMIGSKIYSFLLSDHLPPQLILVLTSGISFLSLSIVGIVITYILYSSPSPTTRTFLIQVCFLCFILYEMCVGIYVPVMGYLKGRVVPEEYRASIANWFRVPMNIFTCISLTFNQISKYNMDAFPQSLVVFKKFYLIYVFCSVFLLSTTLASFIFKRNYSRKFSKEDCFNNSVEAVENSDSLSKYSKTFSNEEAFSMLKDVHAGNHSKTET